MFYNLSVFKTLLPLGELLRYYYEFSDASVYHLIIEHRQSFIYNMFASRLHFYTILLVPK